MCRLAATIFLLAVSAPTASHPAVPPRVRFAGAAQARALWERWYAGAQASAPLAGAFDPVGGTEGVRQVAAGQIEGAAIIAPLAADQLKAAPSLIDLPVAVGAVAVVYNLTIAGDLRLTPELLDGILRGRVTRWRDPALIAANPGAVLPDLPISVFTQPADAGDSRTLRDYLGHALGRGALWSPWSGKELREPREVAEAVLAADGAVAYLDAAQARRASLFLASMRNRDGAFVQPSMRSVSHAAVGVRLPDDFRASIVDARGPEAYPIASFTHAVIDAGLPAERRRPLIAFLRWVLHDGQQHTVAIGYAPLPGLVVRALDARLVELEAGRPFADAR